MRPVAISQDLLFYSPPWSLAKELLLLQEMVRFVDDGRWVPGSVQANHHLVSLISNALVHRDPSIGLTTPQVRFKILQLEQRYKDFHALKEHPFVIYSEATRSVSASDMDWMVLVQIRESWRAYIGQGETAWPFLERIFKERETPHPPAPAPLNNSDGANSDDSIASSDIDSVVNSVWGGSSNSSDQDWF